ncbi:MAG: DUF3179 domain-containing protein [Calditrichaeota bacterium]|nr:MAG: DUF3179 domain-containing protein [Calditrichota bacterium]
MIRFIVFLAAIGLVACDLVQDAGPVPEGAWLIPKSEVRDGGPGKDGIPALTLPAFTSTDAARSYLKDEDLVVMARVGALIRFYPHRILDWHEIVNDQMDETFLTVSYCPLTGSAVGLLRILPIDGQAIATTFGVSGLLYNSNLILYDRATDSYWSQMRNQCVSGKLIGQKPVNIPLVELPFATARALYPRARVLSNQTGVYGSSRYNTYPYGDYRTNNDFLLFDVKHDDNRLPRKERVLGVTVNGASKAYRFSTFTLGTQIARDSVGGTPIIIIGDFRRRFMVALERHRGIVPVEGLQVYDDPAHPEAVMKDTDGRLYDLFGQVIFGPDTGSALNPLESYIAFWFAWAAFHPETDLY